MLAANLHHLVHVGHVTAHMGKKQVPGFRPGCLGVQIVEIDSVVVLNFDELDPRSGVLDSPRHGGQCVGVTENRIPRLDAEALQRDVQGAAAGGAGKTILGPDIGCERLFEFGCIAFFALHSVVTVKPAGGKHAQSLVDAFLGNGFLKREVLVECQHVVTP